MTSSPSLGRGLSALLPQSSFKEHTQEQKSDSGSVQIVSPSQVTAGRFQPRSYFDTEKLQNLAASIKKQGVLQPLLVRPLAQSVYLYEIVAGERRWQAAKLAKLKEIPVLICHLTDQEALEVALVENIQRTDLNAIEEAEGYKRLIEEFSYTQETLSKSVGKSRSHIANTLRLLNLPESLKAQIQKKALTAGHARALLKAHDPEALSQEVLDQGLSVRETEQRVTQGRENGLPKNSDKNPDLVYLEEELRQKLSAKVTLTEKKNSISLRVDFPSFEKLDHFIQTVCS